MSIQLPPWNPKRIRLAAWLILAAALWLLVPLLPPFFVGVWWFYGRGWLAYLIVGGGVMALAAYLMARWALGRLRQELAASPRPSTSRTPTAREVQADLEAIAERVSAAPSCWLEKPDAILHEVFATVARHYFPDSPNPVLERPLPHLLGTIELAARDLRLAVTGNMPFAGRLTLAGMIRTKSLFGQVRDLLWALYCGWRCIRLTTAPGIAQELITSSFNAGLQGLADRLTSSVASELVYRVAHDYAIPLYSGAAVFPDEYRSPLKPSPTCFDFADEATQLLVCGQVKAGKSTLVNLLLDEHIAAVDALPLTDRVMAYLSTREDLPPLVLSDTPGYGVNDDAWNEVREIACDADAVVLVCSAPSAARKVDCQLLAAIRGLNDRKNIPAPILCVLTHVDQLAANHVEEAAAWVAEELGFAREEVIPISLGTGEGQDCRQQLVPAIRQLIERARDRKILRCLREIRKEKDETLLEEIKRFGRLTLGWSRRLLKRQASRPGSRS